MRLVAVICLSFLLLFPITASATRNVSSPVVEANVFRYEARLGIEFDDRTSVDHRLKQTYFLEYGFSDWYAMRVSGRYTKPDGQDNDFTFLDWENRFQFFKEKKDGFDGGLRLIYSHADNPSDADTFDTQFLAQKKFGKWNHRGNIILQREIGDNARSGIILNFSEQSLYALDDKLSAGAEWFGDVGRLSAQSGINDQRHQIGPVISYKLNEKIAIETGYLFGLTDPASDGLFKFFLKGKF